jgi:hypothetical protein
MLVVQGEAGGGKTAPIRSMTASDICGFHDGSGSPPTVCTRRMTSQLASAN